jgi:hypothetical protein
MVTGGPASFVLATGDLHADGRDGLADLSGMNGTIEPGGDHQDERSLRGLQRPFDAGGVEQAESGSSVSPKTIIAPPTGRLSHASRRCLH